jgi:hypothetical protein
LITIWINYNNSIRLARRNEQLNRINKQLGELYGPLYALRKAAQAAYEAFRSKYRVGKPYFDINDPPNNEELEVWRLWMKTVFMPINTKMYELILSKSDLLIEVNFPDSFIILCSHITSYLPVIEKWNKNDFSEHYSY